MCVYVVMKWWREECKISIGKCICGHGVEQEMGNSYWVYVYGSS